MVGGVTAVTTLYTTQIVFRCFVGPYRFHLPSFLFTIDFANLHLSIIRSLSIDSVGWCKARTDNSFQLLPPWPLLLLLATVISTCHMQRILDAEKSTVLRGHCFRWEVNYICCYTRCHRPHAIKLGEQWRWVCSPKLNKDTLPPILINKFPCGDIYMVWILNNLPKDISFWQLWIYLLILFMVYWTVLSVSNGGPMATDELGGTWKLSVVAHNCEGGWGELYNEPNIIRMIGWKRMR
jgi:hypothetical protein